MVENLEIITLNEKENYSFYIKYSSLKEMGKIFLKNNLNNNECFIEDYLISKNKYKSFEHIYKQFLIWNKNFGLNHSLGNNLRLYISLLSLCIY